MVVPMAPSMMTMRSRSRRSRGCSFIRSSRLRDIRADDEPCQDGGELLDGDGASDEARGWDLGAELVEGVGVEGEGGLVGQLLAAFGRVVDGSGEDATHAMDTLRGLDVAVFAA